METITDKKLELACLQFSVEIKDGKLAHGSPRLDVLSNNADEVVPKMADGVYKWRLALFVEDGKALVE